MTPTWSPRQKDVLRLLRWDEALLPSPPDPVVSSESIQVIRAELESTLSVVSPGSAPTIKVTKHDLTSVGKCQGLFTAPSDFEWSHHNVRGKIVARALQIGLAGPRKELSPLELVHAAVDGYAAGDDELADFLQTVDDATMADVLSSSSVAVTTFYSDFPPITGSMIPRIECSVTVPLLHGRIQLKGKYDLALGRPGVGTFIFDLKTGKERPEHGEEIKYYALLEALARSVPPYGVATYYLDGSWSRPFEVSEELLRQAAATTGERVLAIAQLHRGEVAPSLTPGHHCNYCPGRDECEVGLAWLTDRH